MHALDEDVSLEQGVFRTRAKGVVDRGVKLLASGQSGMTGGRGLAVIFAAGCRGKRSVRVETTFGTAGRVINRRRQKDEENYESYGFVKY